MKLGSFNNLSTMMNWLLSSASSSSDEHFDDVASETDVDNNFDDAAHFQLDDVAQFQRLSSADTTESSETLSGRCSTGSMCFGGMAHLHRNVPEHMLQAAADQSARNWPNCMITRVATH